MKTIGSILLTLIWLAISLTSCANASTSQELNRNDEFKKNIDSLSAYTLNKIKENPDRGYFYSQPSIKMNWSNRRVQFMTGLHTGQVLRAQCCERCDLSGGWYRFRDLYPVGRTSVSSSGRCLEDGPGDMPPEFRTS